MMEVMMSFNQHYTFHYPETDVYAVMDSNGHQPIISTQY